MSSVFFFIRRLKLESIKDGILFLILHNELPIFKILNFYEKQIVFKIRGLEQKRKVSLSTVSAVVHFVHRVKILHEGQDKNEGPIFCIFSHKIQTSQFLNDMMLRKKLVTLMHIWNVALKTPKFVPSLDLH